MNTASAYQVNQDYKGQRNIIVPTRMYSRNALLGAMHIKSDRFLGVNLDRYVVTFHAEKDGTNRDPKHEISFSHIKSLEADVSKAEAGKYYLKVLTDDGDLDFKFKNAGDFHSVVEALRNTIHNDKPFINTNESYKSAYEKNKDLKKAYSRDSSVSSDDQKDFHNADKKEKSKKSLDVKKDLNKEIYNNNKDAIKTEDKVRKDIAGEYARENLKQDNKETKDNLNNHYADYKDAKDSEKDRKDAAKDNMKQDLIHGKEQVKDHVKTADEIRNPRY